MKYLVYIFFILISLLPVAFVGWFCIKAFKSKPAIENTTGTQQAEKKKKKKTGKPEKKGFGWLFWIGMVTGIVFFSAGAYRLVEYMNFKKNGIPATGVISCMIRTANEEKKIQDQQESYDVYITFTVEDKEYTFKSRHFDSNMRHGDAVDILYMPDNPEKAIAVKGSILAPVVMMVLSFILLSVFLGYARAVVMDKKKSIENSIESHFSP